DTDHRHRSLGSSASEPVCAHRRARCNRRPSVGRSTSAIPDRWPIRVGHAARSDLVTVLGSDTERGHRARAQSETAGRAIMIMPMFGLGAATPILALAYGSRQAIVARRDLLARTSQIAKPLMGAALVGIGVFVLTGFDKVVEASLTRAMPDWLVSVTTRL